MKVIDVYKQYFKGNCIYNDIQRNGVVITCTATSDQGYITYDVQISFFPHVDEEDYLISYDACIQKNIFYDKGRRSKKKEQVYLNEIKNHADELASNLNGIIYWDKPLREAIYG